MQNTKHLLSLCCVFLAVALGYTLWPAKLAQAATPPSPLLGRYQISGLPGHIYVLDTATGQVWHERAAESTYDGSTEGVFYRAKIDAAR